MDEACPSKYYWILLQDNIAGNLPQIKFWSLFEPEDKNIPFMVQDNPIMTFAAYLLRTAKGDSQILDSYDQPVNLGQYNPNYMRVEQDFAAGFAPEKSPSTEERLINSKISEKIKPNKASFDPGEYKLINAYRYLKAQAKNNIMANMGSYLWDAFIGRLMLETTSRNYGKKKADELQQAMDAGRATLHLDRLKIWREAGSWKYSDMVSLCKLGIPKELRPTIWSELFGLSGSKYPEFERTKASKYRQYVARSMGNDLIVYRQIENDVMDMSALNASRKEEFKTKERPLIMKIAKAYYAWCIEENEKNKAKEANGPPKKAKEDLIEKGEKENQYVYFKGVLYLIQKVSQVFDEIEAFWCVVGFANALPYLFKSQKVMTANIAWNHKLLLLAISTIMEVKYPKIYEAIARHGLPIEYYISDKMLSMLSTVFDTETLLHFYDIIALEAGSKEPLRAMWVILTGCIMLMTLNENYIIPARSAEEISLLINNTGINRLNTQKIVEELYSLCNELFASYNPVWDQIVSLFMHKKDSAIGIKQELGSKATRLEAHYSKVRELTVQTEEILEQIRNLIPGTDKNIDDDYWMANFVRRFCKYYGDNAKKETREAVHVYVYKCYNVPSEVKIIELACGSESIRTMDVQGDGTVNSIEEFPGDDANSIKLTIEGGESCVIDISKYETDTPITIDLPLNLMKSSGKQSNPQKPQMFVSLVILLVTRNDDIRDEQYKRLKECMLNKSTIVSPIKSRAKKGADANDKLKKDLQDRLKSAGLTTIGVIGSRAVELEESKGPKITKENDIKALLHMFSLVKSQTQSYYQSNMPEPESDVSALAEKVYKEFSKHYSGKLPLKRVVVSLIAASCLTVDKKLSYFYRIYTSLTGVGGSEEGENCFLLDDIIELIQLLCELHLVYIPPEDIPHLTEQIITKGGINRITSSYLVSANISTPEQIAKILMNKNLKRAGDTEDVVNVTRQVQATFDEHWQTWEHKQVFTEDSSSFCSSLKEILKGSSARPRKPGPYRLIICYRHNGENFYKVLDYDKNERLRSQKDERRTITDLLLYCKNNFCFVGERIKMSCDEFILRIKQFPMLTELMRLHLATNASVSVIKESTRFKVSVMKDESSVAVVTFIPAEERKDDFGEEDLDATGIKYDFSRSPCAITVEGANKDCLAIEVKEKVIRSINEAVVNATENFKLAKIPDELYSKYLNHSLQLFCDGVAIDDFTRLSLDVSICLMSVVGKQIRA